MNKKCCGCGVVLQTNDASAIGFVKVENLEKSNLCERCFRIKNYGDYKIVSKNNEDYLKILSEINDTNELVVLVIDVFVMNNDLYNLSKILNNPVLIVLSKRDILPKSIYEQKILDYIERYGFNVVDKILISSNKNYNFDELLMMLHKYKKSDKVYIVGYTNAGKSTLINKLLYNYSDKDCYVTTSFLPSTTLDTLLIKLDDSLTLIDTPGILDENSLINQVTGKELKRIVPSKEIKPITYQIKNKQNIIIDDYAIVECLDATNITLFFSSNLKITRTFDNINLNNWKKHDLFVTAGKDVVLSGLGFIKVTKSVKLNVYLKYNINVYTRDSLI